MQGWGTGLVDNRKRFKLARWVGSETVREWRTNNNTLVVVRSVGVALMTLIYIS